MAEKKRFRVSARPGSQNAVRILLRGLLALVGFILSPLSWWNDLVVNFPLSYGFAWGVGKGLDRFMEVRSWLFIQLFVIGYFLTNLLGFLMIHYSVFGLKRVRHESPWKQVLISLLYTAAVVVFFGMDICDPGAGCRVLPEWVVP